MQDTESLIIGSRESLLAVKQAEAVLDYLSENCPGVRTELVTMKTTGDRIMTRLDRIGGKGLFVKELDQALRDGRIDLSVHSLKDMPMETPQDLPVIGFSPREDPRDVLVLPEGITLQDPHLTGEWLAKKGIGTAKRPIGTSSRRRILQLQQLFPDAVFESVRGNIQTRLRKLDEGQYGALVLAAAGLKRLHLEDRISCYFDTEAVIPSAGQGILALQGRTGGDYACLGGFTDPEAAMAAAAERAFVQALGGGCTSPIAAHAFFKSGAKTENAAKMEGSTENELSLTLYGFYYDDAREEGFRDLLTRQVHSAAECAAAGRELAARILKRAGS